MRNLINDNALMTQFLRIIQDDAYFSVGCIIVLILLTFYCHSWAESLFDDFLEGNVGKSKIRRIKKKQSRMNRWILFNYILPLLQRNQSTFRKYFLLYRIWLYSRIISIVIILLMLFQRNLWQIYLILGDIVITNVVALIFRMPSWPGTRSAYSGRTDD